MNILLDINKNEKQNMCILRNNDMKRKLTPVTKRHAVILKSGDGGDGGDGGDVSENALIHIIR